MTRVSLSESTRTKLLFDLEQAAELLDICPRKLWSLTFPRGPIKCVKIGRSVRYAVTTLEQWVADQEALTSGKGASNG